MSERDKKIIAWNSKFSSREIGKKLGINQGTVLNVLEKYGIKKIRVISKQKCPCGKDVVIIKKPHKGLCSACHKRENYKKLCSKCGCRMGRFHLISRKKKNADVCNGCDGSSTISELDAGEYQSPFSQQSIYG